AGGAGDHGQRVSGARARPSSGDGTFSVRDDSPDAWFDLNNPDTVDPPRRMRVTLPITRSDLPPHITGITVAHLTLFVVRADGFAGELTVPALIRTVNGQSTRAASTQTVNGIVS